MKLPSAVALRFMALGWTSTLSDGQYWINLQYTTKTSSNPLDTYLRAVKLCQTFFILPRHRIASYIMTRDLATYSLTGQSVASTRQEVLPMPPERTNVPVKLSLPLVSDP